MIEGDIEVDGPFTLEEFVEFLEETMDAMETKVDKIGRLAVVFGAAVHASGLSKAEARRALARFEGATEWQQAHKPLPGEEVH